MRSPDSIECRSTWNHFLRLHENPWIRDHKIQNMVLYPAAGMVTMAIEGFSQIVPERENLAGFYIEAFTIERPMVVPEGDHGLEVSMVLTNLDRDNFEHLFDIHSKHLNSQWQKNASGRIMIRRQSDIASFEFSQYRSRRTYLEGRPLSVMHPSQLYATVEDRGLNYGPMFRNITSVKVISGGAKDPPACISTIRVPDTKSKMPCQFEFPHFIHPATLDSMVQTLLAVCPAAMVPTGIDKIWISAQLAGEAGVEFEGYSTGTKEGTSGALGTVAMTANGWDVPSVVMDGARLTKMARLPVEKGGHIPFRRNLASEIVWKEDVTSAKLEDLENLLTLLAHKYPGLSVLQVGLGASMAEKILKVLHPQANERSHLSRYTLSGHDGGETTLSKVQELFLDSPLLSCIEARKYPLHSDEEVPSYNLVVSHCSSADMLRDLWKRVLPGGFLLHLAGGTETYGSIESEESVSRRWQYTEGSEIVRCSSLGLRFRLYRKKAKIQGYPSREVTFLIPDKPPAAVKEMVCSLRNSFQAKGFNVVNIKLATLIRLASEADPACPDQFEGTPYVSFLSAQEDDDFFFSWREEQFRAFKHLLKKTKSILWLTRNVYLAPSNPRASLIVGLARTLISEDPQKKIVTLDTSGKALGTSWADLCLEVFEMSFYADTLKPRDVEYATDGKRLLVPRLRTLRTLNEVIEQAGPSEVQSELFARSTERLNLVLERLGSTGGSSHWERLREYEDDLGPREVEIEFVSAPLLEEDFETAIGHTTLTSLGLDICGRVTAAGVDVHDLRQGDVVVGISLKGPFQSIVRLDRGLVAKVPGGDCRLGSKFLLSCYVLAWYAIEPATHNALQRKIFGGRRHSILVHHAMSAHGQAAIILAQALELEIYATAGSHTETLCELGIRDDHILPLGALSRWGGTVDIVYDPTGSFFSESAQHARLCKCLSLFCHIQM